MTGKCAERTKHKLWTTQPQILMIPSNQLTQCNSQPSLLDTTMTLCVNIYFSFVFFFLFYSLGTTTHQTRSTWEHHQFDSHLQKLPALSYQMFKGILSFFVYRSWCMLLMQKPMYLCMYLSGILFAQGPVSRNSSNFWLTKSNIRIKIVRKIMQILHSWAEVLGHFCICGAFFKLHKFQPLPPPHKLRWIRLSRMFLR